MNCKTCGHRSYCDQCEHYKKRSIYETCELCEHRKYGGHKWETIRGQKTCAVCGIVSPFKIFVNDDRLVFCANMTKEYVSRPRQPKKTPSKASTN